jgi:hypothetical protein
MRRNVITFLAIVAGMVLAFWGNYILLEPLIIPSPCYYHERDTSFLFEAFYSLESFAGGHPFPTAFNLLFTLFTGGLVGFFLLKFIRRKISK